MSLSQVTINDVRQAVRAALETAFPGIGVYDQGSGPEPAPPYFLVNMLEPTHTQELGRRYWRVHPFDVKYVALNGDMADLCGKAEQLTDVLQSITISGRAARGTGMRFQIAEGALHFFVNYNFHVWAARPDEPFMANVEVREGLK